MDIFKCARSEKPFSSLLGSSRHRSTEVRKDDEKLRTRRLLADNDEGLRGLHKKT
jgi:hypothetical protein